MKTDEKKKQIIGTEHDVPNADNSETGFTNRTAASRSIRKVKMVKRVKIAVFSHNLIRSIILRVK